MTDPSHLHQRPRSPYLRTVAVRRALFALGVYVASLAVLLLRWLVPQPIGAADNGDGWRLLCALGGNQPVPLTEDWVRMTFPPSIVCDGGYVSSQSWLLRAAVWTGHQLGMESALDLYVLGALTCLLVAFAITVVVLALPLSPLGRVIAAGLLLLVLADSAVFGWFVSVLSEGAAFLGITLTVGGLLLLQRPDRWRYAGAVLTVAGAVLAINAKAQTLFLLPALVLALVLARKPGRHLLTRWALPVLVLVATAGSTVLVQQSGTPAGGEYAQINAYHTIMNSIVRKDSAAEDLAELGLPESWAKYRGGTWWSTPPAAYTDPLWPEYQGVISRRTVLHFYKEHPLRTLGILQAGAQDQLTARPENIGSYVEGSGAPAMAQEFRVPVLSGLARAVAPLGLFVLVPVWLLTAAAAIAAWRRARPVAVVTLFVLVGGLGQFGVAALGEGIEGVKHQVIALFCTFLGLALAGIGLLARRQARLGERSTDAPPERTEVAQEEQPVLA